MPDFRDQLRGAAGPTAGGTSPDALRALVERRRRRRRGVIALCLMLLVVAGAAGVLVLRERTAEVEFTDPAPTALPSATAGPSPNASDAPSPSPSPTPSADARSASPSAPPGDAPSAPAAPSIDDLGAVLLQSEDLPSPAEGFEWQVVEAPAQAPATSALYDPCRPTAYPTDDDRVEVAVQRLQVVDVEFGDAPETPGLVQVVARYPSPAVAAEMFAGLGRVARQCAATPTDVGVVRSEVLASTATRLLIEVRVEGQRVTGPDTVAIERRGDVVVIADLGIGERSLGLSDVGTDLSDAVHVALDRG
jgi:hypothetical protein